jgi:hypothetical protein
MGTGIWQVVSILMSLSGFGVQKDAAAPSAAEVVKYAPDDAETMFYLDTSSLIPGNYDLFAKLPSDPNIKAVPDAAQAIGDMVMKAESGRAMVKSMTGFDPVTDLRSVAGWATMNGNFTAPPSFVVAIRGNFPKDMLDKVAKAAPKGSHKVDKVDGRTYLTAADGHASVGVAADGTVIFGTPALVKARVANGWKAKTPAGSLADRASATLDGKPFLFAATHFSPASQKAIDGLITDDDAAIIRDLVDGQDYASMSLYPDGVGWTYTGKSAAGYQRAITASEGMVLLMRSAHMFTRGLADILYAAVDSYAKNPAVAQIVAHKADLMKLVETWSGDGQFAASWDKKDAQNQLGVRLTGKSLSDVVPIVGLAIPVGAVAALSMGGKEEVGTYAPATPTPVVAPAPMPAPRSH